MSTFENFSLPPALNQALAKMNFSAPTPIQAQALPVGLAGKDLIASAQTGSGKTASFGIPLVAKLLANPKAIALVLAPTRELATQIADVMRDLTMGAPAFRPVILIGGVGIHPQRRALRSNPRIIIATPGRLVDHLSENPRLLNNLAVLVLDEADRMLDMGFAPQLNEIKRALPTTRQTMLFSATYPSDIKELAAKWMNNPERIEIGSVVKPVEAIEQQTIEVEEKGKNDTLLSELKTRQGSVLIFTRTKRRADKLTYTLLDRGIQATMLHGGRSQAQRDHALRGFQNGKFQILVATDIAARGIDVPHIEHVINYDLPFVAEDYLHRIGRTARAGRSGRALCLVSPGERSLWRSIVRLMDRQSGRSSREQREESKSNRMDFKRQDDGARDNRRGDARRGDNRSSRGGPRTERPRRGDSQEQFSRPRRWDGERSGGRDTASAGNNFDRQPSATRGAANERSDRPRFNNRGNSAGRSERPAYGSRSGAPQGRSSESSNTDRRGSSNRSSNVGRTGAAGNAGGPSRDRKRTWQRSSQSAR